jgi:hypothetical protein
MRCIAILMMTCSVVAGSNAAADTLYEAPEECTEIATLRLPECLVRHVSACPNGNIVDAYMDGVYTGRSYYGHPSLFLRFEGADGYVSGHEYGSGTPTLGETLTPGASFLYSRDVYRSEGAGEPGDTGTEEMRIGKRLSIELSGRSYSVLEIRFEVANQETGYLYKELALMSEEPALTIGVVGTHYNKDGSVEGTYSSIPESMSLPGEPGFRSFDPAASCLPVT